MIKIYEEDKLFKEYCMLCNKKYKHNVRYYFNDNFDLPKTADLITHCASCRNLLSRIKETKKKLNFLETDFEYYVYIKDK